MTKQSHPFNPYYVGVWYAGYLFSVAIIILSLSTETTQSLYLFLKNLGAEDMLLSIPRPYHIREFLIARGEVTRWESIMSFFTLMLAGLAVALPIGIIPANRYLAWYSTINETWSKPLAPLGKKTGWWMAVLALSYPLYFFYVFCVGASRVEQTYQAERKIQFSDGGYFYLAIQIALVIVAVQCIHFSAYRFAHNKKIIKQLTTQQGN